MNLSEIVKDSIRYPLLDWKKILILGIIMVISGISIIMTIFLTNITVIGVLVFLGVIIKFFVDGYKIKIIKSSLDGTNKPPEFKKWIEMFVTGIKVNIVFIVYFIPFFLIISAFASSWDLTAVGPFISPSVSSMLLRMGINAISSSGTDLWTFITFLYIILLYPILQIAIANMAYNDSKIDTAFRISQIINKIGKIGLKKFIAWYIIIGSLYLIIDIVGNIIGIILFLLLIAPYVQMYFSRAVALIYQSESPTN